VKELTGQFNAKRSGILNSSGKNVIDEAEINTRWKEYTENLYKKDENITEVFEEKSIEMEPAILKSETKKALCDIAYNKAPGCDGIPTELIKNTGEEGINVITELCQKIWMTGKWPTDWKHLFLSKY